MSRKFWEFRNQVDGTPELLLYGPISEESWWGDEVTPKQFAQDLYSVGVVDQIVVRINSGGGDVFAAHAMCSMLKAHSAKIVVSIDGLAASAATIVAMAGDDIQIPPNAMMMIHDPLLGLRGLYNKNDLSEMSEVLDKVKESIVESYKFKTQMSRDEIINVMEATTWMTGREAVEKGFADTLLEDEVVNRVLNGNTMVLNSVSFDLTRFQNVPHELKKQPEKPESVPTNHVKSGEPLTQVGNKKTKEDASMTAEKLRNENPDLYKEIYDLGVTDERERIKNLDDIRDTLNENIVKDAMFDSGITAEACALRILNANRTAGARDLKNRVEDAAESNAAEIESKPETLETKDEEELAIKNMVAGSRR